MGDWSRRDLLAAAGGGVVAGGVGGVAISPALRRVAGDLYGRIMLPQSPIKAVFSAPDGLMIVLVKDPVVDSLNVISPDGSPLTVFKPDAVEKRQFLVEWSKLSDGRYRIVAARDREIIQDSYVEVNK